MKITVTQLPYPEACGDWHDKPVKWVVTGPRTEVQKFSTKADALKYASIRRRTSSFIEASREYVRS